jgi:Ca-activated chloride channel homolog
MLLENKLVMIVLLSFLTGMEFLAQEEAKNTYYGNVMYKEGKWQEASMLYNQALKEKNDFRKANYNLGSSIYRQAQLMKDKKIQLPANMEPKRDTIAGQMFDEAASQFEIAAQGTTNKDTMQRAFHNAGNCQLLKKDYQKAIDYYKKALKINSKDEETRYNLAYALKHMPKDKNGGGGQNKDQKQNEKQEKEQPQMKKEDAERMLAALKNAEKRIREGKKIKGDPMATKPEKDW